MWFFRGIASARGAFGGLFIGNIGTLTCIALDFVDKFLFRLLRRAHKQPLLPLNPSKIKRLQQIRLNNLPPQILFLENFLLNDFQLRHFLLPGVNSIKVSQPHMQGDHLKTEVGLGDFDWEDCEGFG